jgi:hypothetical protein
VDFTAQVRAAQFRVTPACDKLMYKSFFSGHSMQGKAKGPVSSFCIPSGGLTLIVGTQKWGFPCQVQRRPPADIFLNESLPPKTPLPVGKRRPRVGCDAVCAQAAQNAAAFGPCGRSLRRRLRPQPTRGLRRSLRAGCAQGRRVVCALTSHTNSNISKKKKNFHIM